MSDAPGRRITPSVHDSRPLDRGLAVLLDLSRRIASSGGVDATLRAVVDTVVPALADNATIDLLDDDGTTTRHAAAIAPPHDAHTPALRALALEAALAATLRTGAPLWSSASGGAPPEELASTPESARLHAALGTRAVLAVPLRTHDGVFGVLTLGRRADRSELSDAHVEIAMAVAIRAGLAIGATRAQLQERRAREAAERNASRLESLRRLAIDIAGASTAHDVLEAISGHARTLLGAQRAGFALPSVRPGWLELVASDALAHEATRARWATFPIGAPLPLAVAFREGRALLHETQASMLEAYPDLAAYHDMKHVSAAVAVPLRSTDRVIGAMVLGFEAPHRFDADDVALVETIASQTATVLERVSLYERSLREAERQRLLARASELLASSLDYARTLRAMAELAIPTFADWSAVDLFDDDGTVRRVAVHHADPAKVELVRSMFERWPTPRAQIDAFIASAQPILIPEMTDDVLVQGAQGDAEYLRLSRELELRSYLSAPIRVRGEVRGAITFAWAESPRYYGEDDVEVALDLARRAGTALEHATLYTEVRAAERQAEMSRRLFEQMASASPDTIFVVDAKTGRNVYVNRFLDHGVEWVRSLGPALLPTLVHPDDLPGVLDRMSRIPTMRDGEALEESYRMRHADGSYRWLDVRSVVFTRDEEGRPAELLGVARDVTIERARDEALRRSEETHRLATQAVRGLVYEWDFETASVHRSPGIRDIVGFDVDEVPTDPSWWRDRIHPDDVHHADARWQQLQREETEVADTEYRVLHRDGSYRHVWDRACVLRDDASGRVLRLVGCTIDVTERVRARNAIEEADRRKTEFLALLGHELRNPLAAISSAVQVLELLGPPEPRLTRARGVIVRQVGHMARLLDDLLDLSRIARGKLSLELQPLDLCELVRDCVEDHRSEIERSGASLALELPSEAMSSAGDPTRLAQVLGNLLHNAAKFTSPGGHIDVALRADDGRAVLSVRDDGIGIAPAAIERIFEPFVQDERRTDRSQGGLGLGLALVRGLVELHGGTVRAQSEGHGRGAELTITLPLREPAPSAELASAPAETRPRRVLIVEDNEDAAEMLRMVLESGGHHVEVAHTGSEAIARARALAPEVVLCDIGLPGVMDGYDVARALRRDAATKGARLVALTGYGQEEDQRRAMDAGFDRHVTKPVDPRALGSLVGS
ncbi:PAS domain-containing protein [Sandaracinus amylolyticus]|uniref:histidine kinase n=1 Tax=Sandaracinus amylolyticus TaxID=927083 RepID=A0A0F6W4G0_9BACT|nr:PAS domain-containing protein [Sandaracinus amylolyticus]AKF07237.1 Chemotaxis protein methyltransferase CheR [Sandaracinus amylolyticus]